MQRIGAFSSNVRFPLRHISRSYIEGIEQAAGSPIALKIECIKQRKGESSHDGVLGKQVRLRISRISRGHRLCRIHAFDKAGPRHLLVDCRDRILAFITGRNGGPAGSCQRVPMGLQIAGGAEQLFFVPPFRDCAPIGTKGRQSGGDSA